MKISAFSIFKKENSFRVRQYHIKVEQNSKKMLLGVVHLAIKNPVNLVEPFWLSAGS